MNRVLGVIATGLSNIIGRPQIDPNDGVDTATERMIPGTERHEVVIWVLERVGKGGLMAVVLWFVWNVEGIQLFAGVGLGIWLLIELVQHLNTLVTAKTWSLVSLFVLGLCVVLFSRSLLG